MSERRVGVVGSGRDDWLVLAEGGVSGRNGVGTLRAGNGMYSMSAQFGWANWGPLVAQVSSVLERSG